MARSTFNQPVTNATDVLIFDEIRHIVSKAIAGGETLRAGPHVHRLSEIYPSASMSQGRIADEIILAASKAGVAVEISRAESGSE